MPYVNIKITNEGASSSQKAALISGVTELLVGVLGKDPAMTFVVIDEVETEDWGIGGLPCRGVPQATSMTDMTEPTRRLLDLLRIEVPIVNAPMARLAGGALARCPPLRRFVTGWRCGRSSTSRSRRTSPRRCSCPWEHPGASSLGADDGLRAGTCRCMTIPTPSWPTCPRYATATST